MKAPLFAVFLLLLCALAQDAGSRPAVPGIAPGAEQRSINDCAAALDAIRHTVITNTGLRLPGEALPVYLARICRPLSSETGHVYQKRIAGYLQCIQQGSRMAAHLQPPPRLQNNSPANATSWRHALNAARQLPILALRLQNDWQTDRAKGKPLSAAPFEQTINLALAGYQSLRDAQP